MKTGKLYIGISLLALIIVTILAGCDIFGGEHTVWTGTKSYDAFEAEFGEMADYYYVKIDFDDYQFSKVKKTLSDKNKHSWSETQIEDWFMERDFSYNEARSLTTYIITTKHGCIASRTKNIVYIIVK